SRSLMSGRRASIRQARSSPPFPRRRQFDRRILIDVSSGYSRESTRWPASSEPERRTLMRLDKRIAQLFGLSRRAAQEAVRQGQVDVNGEPCLEPALEVEPQAQLVYHANRPRAGTTARRLHVLYEDPQILIV